MNIQCVCRVWTTAGTETWDLSCFNINHRLCPVTIFKPAACHWLGPYRRSSTQTLQGKQHSDTQVLWTEAFYWNNGKQGDYFFLDTPTVRPRRPVVLVCWPRTRRLQGKEKTALTKSSCLNSYRRINSETGLKRSALNLLTDHTITYLATKLVDFEIRCIL